MALDFILDGNFINSPNDDKIFPLVIFSYMARCAHVWISLEKIDA